ncbi:uncharacterized protein LOC21388890 [Morus notabilis]|uniref:uncharacterized protein LOC21388890 n=1 Tax=Morus notabilis TaxID=981085 RepID=UPI000CECFE3F|nr:uncharacterized protein LOC21388890 [Morus notabilis]
MIPAFIKISILIKNWTPLFLSLLLLLLSATTTAMKVHPMPKKRNITIQYDMSSSSRNPQDSFLGLAHKKLRRLPHIFSRVLELPFRSDADVSVEESADFFRFVAETDGVGGEVRAHTVEIHPGVTKIVVRESGSHCELTLDELELDVWRFRLPETTRPELASAVLVDGELIVTVPKGGDGDGGSGDAGEVWGDGKNGGFGGGNVGGRLVLVQ